MLATRSAGPPTKTARLAAARIASELAPTGYPGAFKDTDMPTALYRLILAGLLLLPWTAQAGDAEDFVAGNSGEQARLLETWAAQPDPARLELLNALQQGQLNIAGESRTLRLNNLSLIHI